MIVWIVLGIVIVVALAWCYIHVDPSGQGYKDKVNQNDKDTAWQEINN